MLYDIIQVEDDLDNARILRENAERANLTYLGAANLSALQEALQVDSARVFVVDGRFPRVEKGVVEKLAREAVVLIKSKVPQAEVIIYSSDFTLGEVAKEMKVDYKSKNQYLGSQLVKIIRAQLS